jgi:osmoprotectant transport system permease protein
MRRAQAVALGVRTIGDLRGHPMLRFALTHEFLERREGWPAIRSAYGLAPTDVRGVQHVVAYRALATEAADVIDLYTTDAEIEALDLVALEDDRRVFPDYAAFVLYRAAEIDLAGPLRRAIEKLEGTIDADTMIAMNRRVKMDRHRESDVAADFVASRWGGEGVRAGSGRTERVWRRTREHLFLVGVAMLATVLVGLPLGVLAARSAWLGSVLLGVAGVLQTVPSLALLVFLIPVLGIGEAPALVALILYGLLPVMRNTALGLQSIPPDLAESARALGLDTRARLWRIELPLALPAILAGLKTASTLAVGTATLGALIGAGGYGQPILEGLRRDELARTLEGAIPAALLAIVVQALFAGFERAVVPRGLRLRAEAARGDA